MNMTTEERVSEYYWWVVSRIKEAILTSPKNFPIQYELSHVSAVGVPNNETEENILKRLEEIKAIRIANNAGKDWLMRWQKKQDKFKSLSKNEVSSAKSALEALKDEEDRYIQAYGSKLMTFEKYKELMIDINAKRKAIEEQAKETLNIVDERINLDDIDSVCKEIMDDLQEITVEKKQKYMRGMIKSIYVKERSNAFVNGYIPLSTQAQNIQDEHKRWDCGVT